jgi:hypothetical protein
MYEAAWPKKSRQHGPLCSTALPYLRIIEKLIGQSPLI